MLGKKVMLYGMLWHHCTCTGSQVNELCVRHVSSITTHTPSQSQAQLHIMKSYSALLYKSKFLSPLTGAQWKDYVGWLLGKRFGHIHGDKQHLQFVTTSQIHARITPTHRAVWNERDTHNTVTKYKNTTQWHITKCSKHATQCKHTLDRPA